MCSRDLDCANNQVCMTNTSWYVPTTTESLGCVCSTYYGFSNFPICDAVLETTTSHFWLVSGLVLILMSIVLIYQPTKQLIRLNHHNMLAIDPTTVGMLQAWVGAMCCLIAQAGHIASALQPERAEHTSGNLPEEDKENDFHLVWLGFQGVSCVTVTCGAITIALMWVNVATRVNNMQMGSTNSSGDNETSWANPKLVAVIQFVFLLAVLIPMGTNYSFIALVASYFLELGTLGFYLYGSFKISKLIGVVRGNANRVVSVGSSPGDSYTQLLRRMQRSVLVISVCFVAGVVFSTLSLFPTAFGWKEYARSSDVVSMQIWALQCLYLTVLITGLEVVRFLRQSIDNRVVKAAIVTISSLHAGRPMSNEMTTPSVIMVAELNKHKTGI